MFIETNSQSPLNSLSTYESINQKRKFEQNSDCTLELKKKNKLNVSPASNNSGLFSQDSTQLSSHEDILNIFGEVNSQIDLLFESTEEIEEKEESNGQCFYDHVKKIKNQVYADRILQQIKDAEQSACHFLEGHQITESMRSVMINWMSLVTTTFKRSQQTFFLAINIMDRYFQSSSNIKKEDLHLIGTTCFFIASKYEDIYPLTMKNVTQILTKGKFTSQIIKQKEVEILDTLKYSVTFPTLFDFSSLVLYKISSKLTEEQKINYMELCTSIIKMASLNYQLMSNYKYSYIAAAAILVSLEISYQQTDIANIVKNLLDIKDDQNFSDCHSYIKELI